METYSKVDSDTLEITTKRTVEKSQLLQEKSHLLEEDARCDEDKVRIAAQIEEINNKLSELEK